MNFKDDLISIVVPVYNAAPYIRRTLDSVWNQTYHNWELILVNDGSTDNSVEEIKIWLEERKPGRISYEGVVDQKILLIDIEENKGPAYARNKGLELIKGRFLAFLDADDYWESDKLEKQLRFMRTNNYAFSFTGYEFADKEGVRNGKKVYVPECISYKEALVNTTISTITVMFDRSKLMPELLVMPEECSREDTATWWHVLKHGYKAFGLNETLSVYCRHKGSHSYNKIKAVIGTYMMYRQQEKFGIIRSMVYLFLNVLRAVERRL